MDIIELVPYMWIQFWFSRSKESKGKAGKASKAKESKGKAEKESSKATNQVFGADALFTTVKKENAYLRDFLLKAIQTKVDDLKLYQFAMNSVREQYVETVKELNAPPPPDSAEGESPPLEVPANWFYMLLTSVDLFSNIQIWKINIHSISICVTKCIRMFFTLFTTVCKFLQKN